MKCIRYFLEGNSLKELNIEIRYNLASAKVDGAELAAFTLSIADEKDADRALTCVTKILGTMRKEGVIKFYVTSDSFSKETTESEYIKNKYCDFINSLDSQNSVYVKI